jgi:hypothetical protein
MVYSPELGYDPELVFCLIQILKVINFKLFQRMGRMPRIGALFGAECANTDLRWLDHHFVGCCILLAVGV